MYISRIRLSPDEVTTRDLVRLGGTEGYRVHQQLWRLFQGAEQRDFLYRREHQSPWPAFIAVSVREPTDPDGPWTMETKPYAPKLTEGMQLGFTLTVNPVITRKDEAGHAHRHDVVMDAKFQARKASRSETRIDFIREAGTAWLQKRTETHGFVFDPAAVLVDGYRQHRLAKRDTDNVQFSTLDFSGVLSVTDASNFVRTLYHGIGPAKAFSCGLLLVRRL